MQYQQLGVCDVGARLIHVDRPVHLASPSQEECCHLEAVHRLCLVLNERAEARTTCYYAVRFGSHALEQIWPAIMLLRRGLPR